MPVVLARVSDALIDRDELVGAVDGGDAGALCVFLGQIRDHDPEARGQVVGIDYSGHPDADRIIGEIAARECERLDPGGTARVAVAHRVGHLEVGDLAFAVAVASGHRGLGFELIQAVVDATKAELPIWKHQFEADGRAVWSNLDASAT